ncbi:MAG: hypothetical protein JWQ87_523 [Candidatus Sulfotelmatobacter sp.]|nr:hypothetical protein [Candidatus Sulfotelmatobacter sp.]
MELWTGQNARQELLKLKFGMLMNDFLPTTRKLTFRVVEGQRAAIQFLPCPLAESTRIFGTIPHLRLLLALRLDACLPDLLTLKSSVKEENFYLAFASCSSLPTHLKAIALSMPASFDSQ